MAAAAEDGVHEAGEAEEAEEGVAEHGINTTSDPCNYDVCFLCQPFQLPQVFCEGDGFVREN